MRSACKELLERLLGKQYSGYEASANTVGSPGEELVLMANGTKLGHLDVGWFQSGFE